MRTILRVDSQPYPRYFGIYQFSIDKNGDIYAPLSYEIYCPNSLMIRLNSTTRNATILAGSSTVGYAESSVDLTAALFSNIQQTLIRNGEIYVVQTRTNIAGFDLMISRIRVINTCPGNPNYGTRLMYDTNNQMNAIAFNSRGDACNLILTIDISTNICIIKISDGNVNPCFAGKQGVSGSSDGPAGIGKFNNPFGFSI